MGLSQTRHVTWRVVQAMTFLKNNGVIHGDIKPENVIVSSAQEVRLSDFGCSCRIEECNSRRFKVCLLLVPSLVQLLFRSKSPW